MLLRDICVNYLKVVDGAENHYSAYLLVTFDCDALRYSKGDLCASQSSPLVRNDTI